MVMSFIITQEIKNVCAKQWEENQILELKTLSTTISNRHSSLKVKIKLAVIFVEVLQFLNQL